MSLIQIYTIVYRDGPDPRGTFAQGDAINIYYDTVAAALQVQLNTVVITASAGVIDPNTNSDSTGHPYKTEYSFNPTLCQGTTLLQFTRISAFPWESTTLVTNSPSCAVSPPVCDLAFQGFPTVTNASTTSTTDGAISATATSTNTPIQYKLNFDFLYNDGTGQTTASFTGLMAGTYKIYARDASNCSTILTVLVGANSLSAPSTYGTHYRLAYSETNTEILPTPLSRIDILERGYTGSIVEVQGSSTNPFVYSLRNEGSLDKFSPVMAAEVVMTLNSQTNFAYTTLFTNDPEKYRISWTKSYDGGSSYLPLFIGPLVPDVYNEPYVLTHDYPVNVTATDGFALLKDIPFLGVGGARITGQVKSIQALAQALGKLNLQLSIRVGINLYESTMTTAASDDPLDQSYVNTDAYYISGAALSCLEVIKNIIEPYGARIVQWGGYWNIIRVEELKTSYDYREFDYLGVYITNGSTNPKQNISPAGTASSQVLHGAMLEIVPSYGKFIVDYTLGVQQNLIKNGDFRLQELYAPNLNEFLLGIDLSGFAFVTNGDTITKTFSKISNDNIALAFKAQGNAYILTLPFTMQAVLTDTIRISLTYLVPQQKYTFLYQRIIFIVRWGVYYLKDDGTWTTDISTITIYENEYGKYKTYEVSALGDNPTADFQITLYHSYAKSAEFTDVTTFRTKVTVGLLLGTRTEYNDGTFMHYYELTEDALDPESVPTIVRPNDFNASTNPVQWVRTNFAYLSEYSSKGDTFFIDAISVAYQPGDETPPDTDTVELNGQIINGNNVLPQILTKPVFHSSLLNYINSVSGFSAALYDNLYNNPQSVVSVPSAAYIFLNYLRNSTGAGLLYWKRDGVDENLFLHQLLAFQLAGQYNTPSKKLTGSIRGNIQLSPLITLVETFDSNTLYIPNSLDLNDRLSDHKGEWMELKDVLSTGGGSNCNPIRAFSCGFSNGFS